MMGEEKKIETESVEAVATPPRARVTEEFERKRDYLAGFLNPKPEAEPVSAPGGELHEAVVDALKSIYDPEIPVDIYELGLIYNVDLLPAEGKTTIKIDMTMTSPMCPAGPQLIANSKQVVGALPGVAAVEVKIVLDPPWTPDKMTDEARDQLGIF